jgi:hypothetical protein
MDSLFEGFSLVALMAFSRSTDLSMSAVVWTPHDGTRNGVENDGRTKGLENTLQRRKVVCLPPVRESVVREKISPTRKQQSKKVP